MKNWSDEKVLDSTRALVDEERRITLEVIRHLREIKRRRLYAERGFDSMWNFMIRDLRYSEPATQQRLAVIRLLEEVPGAEKYLESGRISFSSFVELEKAHRLTKRPISELLSMIVDKTLRETKKILSSEMKGKYYRESVRVLPDGLTEVRLILEGGECDSLERLRALRSHERPRFRMGKHFAAWVQKELDRQDPLKQGRAKAPKVTNPRSPHIPKHLRAEIWKRDGGACSYVDPVTGRLCASTAFLQIDHIVPRALGGRNEAGNLRLLCREHNLMHAAESFGADFLESFRH